MSLSSTNLLSTSKIVDSVDQSKILEININGAATGTETKLTTNSTVNRLINFPNKDGTILLNTNIKNIQSGSVNVTQNTVTQITTINFSQPFTTIPTVTVNLRDVSLSGTIYTAEVVNTTTTSCDIKVTFTDGPINYNTEFISDTNYNSVYINSNKINGKPAVVYRENNTNLGNTQIIYAINSETDGSGFWTYRNASIGLTEGTVNSITPVFNFFELQLLEVNGAPYILFRAKNTESSNTFKNIYYNRGSDANGTNTWPNYTNSGVRLIVSSSNVDILRASIISGNPAIVYIDNASASSTIIPKLSYKRASNINGTSYGATVTVASFNQTSTGSTRIYFGNMDFKEVNGRPFIVYTTSTNGSTLVTRIRYARGNDATGTSFNANNTIVTQGLLDFDNAISLEIVNGNPAIAYIDSNNGSPILKYRRSNNADGTSWTSASINITDINDGREMSLRVVNGFPVISYIDPTNNQLKIAFSNNANGASGSWQISTIENIGDTTTFGPISSTIINNHITIAYARSSNNVKFFYGNVANLTYDISYVATE